MTSLSASARATAITSELRRARVSLFIVFFAQGLGFGSLFARLPAIKERFELSDSTLALLTLALPLIAGVATFVTGIIVQRIYSDLVLRIAIVCELVAVVVIGFAPDMLTLIPAWIVMGASFGTVDATMNMKAVALQERYQRSIVVGFYAIYSAAGIIASFAAAWTAHVGLPLWMFFGVEAVVLVPLLLVTGHALIYARIGAHRQDGARSHPTKVRVPWWPVISVGVVLASTYFIESSVASWGAVYIKDTLRAPESIAALAYGGYSAAMLVGRLSADRLIRAIGSTRVIQLCALIALLAMIAVVAAPAPAVALIGFFFAGAGLCVIAPLAFAAAGTIDPNGVAVARANAFTYAGFLLGAALIGPIADMSSMRNAYLISVALAVVILLMARSLARRLQHTAAVSS